MQDTVFDPFTGNIMILDDVIKDTCREYSFTFISDNELNENWRIRSNDNENIYDVDKFVSFVYAKIFRAFLINERVIKLFKTDNTISICTNFANMFNMRFNKDISTKTIILYPLGRKLLKNGNKNLNFIVKFTNDVRLDDAQIITLRSINAKLNIENICKKITFIIYGPNMKQICEEKVYNDFKDNPTMEPSVKIEKISNQHTNTMREQKMFNDLKRNTGMHYIIKKRPTIEPSTEIAKLNNVINDQKNQMIEFMKKNIQKNKRIVELGKNCEKLQHENNVLMEHISKLNTEISVNRELIDQVNNMNYSLIHKLANLDMYIQHNMHFMRQDMQIPYSNENDYQNIQQDMQTDDKTSDDQSTGINMRCYENL